MSVCVCVYNIATYKTKKLAHLYAIFLYLFENFWGHAGGSTARNPLQCSELHSELPARKYKRKCIYKLHAVEHELHLLLDVGIKSTDPKRTDILPAASIN